MELLMHLFMDIMDILSSGTLQSVELDMNVVQDWLFIILIPWFHSLDEVIPCCTSVPQLNLIDTQRVNLGE